MVAEDLTPPRSGIHEGRSEHRTAHRLRCVVPLGVVELVLDDTDRLVCARGVRVLANRFTRPDVGSVRSRRLVPGDHPRVATCLNNVAVCLTSLGQAQKALPRLAAVHAMHKRLFPGDHPDVARSLNNLAGCLEFLGQTDKAILKIEAALAMQERLFPGDHPDVAMSNNNLAECLESLGQVQKALPRYEMALAMQKRLFPGDHPDVAESLRNLANCLDEV